MEESSLSQNEINIPNIEAERYTKCSDDNSIYLSVVWFSGYLGAAYYDSDTAAVHFLLETVESPPYNSLLGLLEELKPIVVITSARQDAQFLTALEKLQVSKNSSSVVSDTTNQTTSEHNIESDSSLSDQFSLEMLSSAEFDYQSSKHRILSVDLPGIPEHFTTMERTLHLSSSVPLDNHSTIRAAGGLLKYLEKKRIGVMLDHPSVTTPILSFQTFTNEDKMRIDKDSYNALQIFQSIGHPSAYKASTREGLSLFGVLNCTVTRHGHKLLKNWFFRPTLDKTVLNRRFDAVSFFVNSRNEENLLAIKSNLKHIKNVTKIIAKIKTSKLNVADWVNILQTAQSALNIADICHGIINSCRLTDTYVPSIFKDILQRFGHDLGSIATMITNLMDVSGSKQENRFVVLSGISNVVDDMKQAYAQLPSLLDKVAQDEVETYNDYLSVCQIVYMRRIGYLLFVSKHVISKVADASLNIPGMTFVAATDEIVFYKTPATERLDKEYGDILENIAYHEMEIMNQLQNKLFEHSSIFASVMKFTAELDCLISLATVSRNYKYVRPTFIEGTDIHVIGARHPMQEHAVSLFVPNDIHFESGKDMIKILTGPNASGKSVYLKQVGLVVFMAHIGSFVPAESATIGDVSSIHTIIRSSESLSSQLSTFANDLSSMATAIRNSDEHSILLIDEFGKGTATLDGIALLTSCLSHFIQREKPPRVLCATHFHCITQRSLLPPSNIVCFHVMDSVIRSSSDSAYLYQLINGTCKQSHSSIVARTAGVPAEIVDRGREISQIIQCRAPIYKFDKSSALTYQVRCNKVAEYASKFQLASSSQLKQLLGGVTRMLREKSYNASVQDTASSDTN